MKQLFFILSVLISFSIQAQKLSAEQYIQTYAPTAVCEMERSGIPASITLAQGLLESGNGNSPLAATANNHFGIKCHKEWTGDTYYQDDDEKNECFRYYTSANESYIDHTDFLMTRSRYAFLFSYAKTDYTSWANGLKQAGYATNPQYPNLLVDLINKYSLHQYDLKSIADFPSYKTAPIIKQEQQKETVVKQETITDNKPITTVTKTTSFKEEVVVPIEAYFGEVYLVNNIKAIIAKKGDTPLGIANRYNVPLNYFYKYNDLHEGEPIAEGKYIYFQPKRNKGYAKYHKVVAGESMYEISQAYGIKLIDLYEKNMMESGEEAKVGEVVYLRETNIKKPATITYDELLKEKTASSNSVKQTSNSSLLSSKTLEKSIQAKSVSQTTEAKNTISTNNNQSELIAANTTNKNVESNKNTENIISTTVIKSHEVKPGDTVFNISKRYGINLEDIIKWNNIENYAIKLGQVLNLTP